MNFLQHQAIYLQICDFICENILRGHWVEGARIPSIRELAVSVEVNPNTVQRSYNFLQEKEIIFNQRGLGYFVAPQSRQKTQAYLKDVFIKNDLPQVFKKMVLLGFSLRDLEPYYDAYLLEVKKN